VVKKPLDMAVWSTSRSE